MKGREMAAASATLPIAHGRYARHLKVVVAPLKGARNALGLLRTGAFLQPLLVNRRLIGEMVVRLIADARSKKCSDNHDYHLPPGPPPIALATARRMLTVKDPQLVDGFEKVWRAGPGVQHWRPAAQS
jgi:hypothetical protein